MPCYSLAPINFSLAERATMVYTEIKKTTVQGPSLGYPACKSSSFTAELYHLLPKNFLCDVSNKDTGLPVTCSPHKTQPDNEETSVYPYKNDWETPTPPPTNWQSSRERVPFLWGGYTEDCTIETGVADGTLSSPPVYHGSYLSRSGRFILMVKSRPLDPPCPHCYHRDLQSFCLLASAVLKPGP